MSVAGIGALLLHASVVDHGVVGYLTSALFGPIAFAVWVIGAYRYLSASAAIVARTTVVGNWPLQTFGVLITLLGMLGLWAVIAGG